MGINEWELLHLDCKTLLGINPMGLCRGPEGLTEAGSTNTSREAAATMVTPLPDTPALVKYLIYFSMVQQWKSHFALYRKSKLDSQLRAVRDSERILKLLVRYSNYKLVQNKNKLLSFNKPITHWRKPIRLLTGTQIPLVWQPFKVAEFSGISLERAGLSVKPFPILSQHSPPSPPSLDQSRGHHSNTEAKLALQSHCLSAWYQKSHPFHTEETKIMTGETNPKCFPFTCLRFQGILLTYVASLA